MNITYLFKNVTLEESIVNNKFNSILQEDGSKYDLLKLLMCGTVGYTNNNGYILEPTQLITDVADDYIIDINMQIKGNDVLCNSEVKDFIKPYVSNKIYNNEVYKYELANFVLNDIVEVIPNTKLCNLNCIFCFHDEINTLYEHIKLEDIIKSKLKLRNKFNIKPFKLLFLNTSANDIIYEFNANALAALPLFSKLAVFIHPKLDISNIIKFKHWFKYVILEMYIISIEDKMYSLSEIYSTIKILNDNNIAPVINIIMKEDSIDTVEALMVIIKQYKITAIISNIYEDNVKDEVCYTINKLNKLL